MKKPPISIPSGFKGILSKKTILSLPPGLSYRAIHILSSAYPEKTISSGTRLSALYELWLSQQKSEGRHLREAEAMMAEVQRLHFQDIQRQVKSSGGEKTSRRSPPMRRKFPGMLLHSRLPEKLAMLGITDRNTVHRLEKSMGSEELESRVDSALETFAGREPVGKAIFSRKPELLVQGEDRLFDLLDGFKTRMKTVDGLRAEAEKKGVRLPLQWDYLAKPEILLNDGFLYGLWRAQLERSMQRGG